MLRKRKATNEIGHVYGRLTVLSRAPDGPKPRRAMWVCKCECGTIKSIEGRLLRLGLTRSCGCLRKELLSERNRNGRAKRSGALACD